MGASCSLERFCKRIHEACACSGLEVSDLVNFNSGRDVLEMLEGQENVKRQFGEMQLT